MEDVFMKFVQQAKYLMVDETTELVGVKSEISTDGYTVYRMFDGEESKVLHIGCWTHCRRLWVDTIPSERSDMEIIDLIGDMFRNEDLFRTIELSHAEIKDKRKQLTGPIMVRILHNVVMMLEDTATMANELMRKAANYTINQWKP